MKRLTSVFASFSIMAIAVSACAAQTGEETSSTSSALVLTTCTGPAILAAVAAGGEVDLACGSNQAISFSQGMSVTRNVVLKNVSSSPVTFVNASTLFDVASGVSFEMDGVSLTGQGTPVHGVGATVTLHDDQFSHYPGFVVSVHQSSSLTVDGCTFTSNDTSSTFAGSIYLEGSTGLVTQSTFQGNSSVQQGGAIVDFGNLTVVESRFFGNSAALGGAIYAGVPSSTLRVSGSTFTGNVATQAGGAIYYAGTAQAVVSGSVISGNSSPQVVGNVLVQP